MTFTSVSLVYPNVGSALASSVITSTRGVLRVQWSSATGMMVLGWAGCPRQWYPVPTVSVDVTTLVASIAYYAWAGEPWVS